MKADSEPLSEQRAAAGSDHREIEVLSIVAAGVTGAVLVALDLTHRLADQWRFVSGGVCVGITVGAFIEWRWGSRGPATPPRTGRPASVWVAAVAGVCGIILLVLPLLETPDSKVHSTGSGTVPAASSSSQPGLSASSPPAPAPSPAPSPAQAGGPVFLSRMEPVSGDAPTKGSTSLNGEALQNSLSYKFPDKLGPLAISSTYVFSQHQAFRAVVGHEAGSGCEKIKFEVFADQERVDQQVVRRDQTARINAPVGGHTKLKLQMTGLNRDSQDAFCGATAVWGDAELI